MSIRLDGLGLHRCSSLRVALALLGLRIAIGGCVLPGATAPLGARRLIRLGLLLLISGSRSGLVEPLVLEEIMARSINIVQAGRGEAVEPNHVSQQGLEIREIVGLAPTEVRQIIRLNRSTRDWKMGGSDLLRLYARCLAGLILIGSSYDWVWETVTWLDDSDPWLGC